MGEEKEDRRRSMKKVTLLMMIIAVMMMSGCGKMQIGYVDGEKLMDAPQIKAVREEGEQKLKEAEEKVRAELEAAAESSTDEEKNKAQLEAQRKLIGIQQAYATQMKQKIDAAMVGIVKEKNVDVVLDSSEDNKVVHEGGIDLTEEVMEKLK